MTGLSYAELLEKFHKALDIAYPVFAEIYPLGYGIDQEVERRIKALLKKHTKDVNTSFTTLAVASKHTMATAEQESLYKLAVDFSEEGLEKHTERFCWQDMRHFKGTPFTKEFYRQRIKEIKEPEKTLAEFEANLKELEAKAEEEAAKYAVDKELSAWIPVLRDIITLRTDKKDALTHFGYCSMPLLAAMAQQLDVRSEEMPYFTIEELDAKQIPSDLKERMEHYNDDLVNGKTVIYTGTPPASLLKGLPIAKASKEVRGMSCYPGTIEAPACVIKTKAQLNKMKPGRILVTTMTTPDYIAAIEKSVGIITDEGGVTCHAAIISRELKKPCIVGTLNGTVSFADGDTIKLDATKGHARRAE